MAAAKFHSAASLFPRYQEIFTSTNRRRIGGWRVNVCKAKLSDSNAKKANLSARKKERIRLPNYGDDGYGGKNIHHISEFIGHPCGIEAILNTRALRNYQSLGSNVYSLDMKCDSCIKFARPRLMKSRNEKVKNRILNGNWYTGVD